ncbi:MAG: hypothetical protein EKK41_07360 [Hyphomicrobiales bacterium]|nr:MAG: hypothetical protein EKK41_07360 [Hyphomicrobiales bacterium]
MPRAGKILKAAAVVVADTRQVVDVHAFDAQHRAATVNAAFAAAQGAEHVSTALICAAWHADRMRAVIKRRLRSANSIR